MQQQQEQDFTKRFDAGLWVRLVRYLKPYHKSLLLMIGMMLVIIIILMTKVMPVFDQVFRQFGQEMTGFSRGILLAGNALSRYSAVFAVLLAVIVCAGIYFTKTESGRKKIQLDPACALHSGAYLLVLV